LNAQSRDLLTQPKGRGRNGKRENRRERRGKGRKRKFKGELASKDRSPCSAVNLLERENEYDRLAFNRFSMKFDNAFQVYLDACTYTTRDGKELYTKLFYD